METTRHFVATVSIVNDGATALHYHDRLDMWLPPGGHLERDELPHEAARREVAEETGLAVELLAKRSGVDTATVRSLPEPARLLLEDIDRYDGEVGHQRIDFAYYGRVRSRTIDPEPGEAPADAWRWFAPAELRGAAVLAPDVVELVAATVEAVTGP